MTSLIQRFRGLFATLPDHTVGETFAALTGEPVDDVSLYEEAMRHRSLIRESRDPGSGSNERLEFLGDAILGFVAAEYLYARFPDEDEGYMTRLRAKLVSGKALAARAEAMGLSQVILISENMAQLKGHRNASILADAFEALIGAVYLDQGIEAARRFVHRAALEPVDLESLASRDDNFKSLLLEFAQARGWAQPSYRVAEMEGPSHQRSFTVEAIVEGEARGSGTAGSKKRAEQRAAAEALRVLTGEEDEDAGDGDDDLDDPGVRDAAP